MENDFTSATAASTIFDPTPSPAIEQRARWYTPGFSDGLGDRLLMFDNSTASSLELLRFSRECSDSPAFETALRQRVDELSGFRHPSVAVIRKVEWLGSGEEGLALVSTHTPGRRLSELLHEARGPALALELIRQIAPVLAALQQQGPGIAHGTLTAERIVVTPEGRLVVVEHVLGAALASLQLPASRLCAEFGIAVPTGRGPVNLDGRGDVIQLGFVALSLLVGRRIKASDYPEHVATLLDEFGRTFGGSTAPPLLRRWLERALQHSDRPFSSAQEATDALNNLPNELEPPAARVPKPLAAVDVGSRPAGPVLAAPPNADGDDSPIQISARPSPVVIEPATAQWAPSRVIEPPSPSDSVESRTILETSAADRPASPARWVVPILAALVGIEALVIAGLVYTRPAAGSTATTVVNETRPAPAPAAVDRTLVAPPPGADATHAALPPPDTRVDATTAKVVSGQPVTRTKGDDTAGRATPPGELFGGVRVSSPIDLQVFEDGKLMGSTAGPVAMTAGSHTLDLVNDTVGYRARQPVSIVAGQMALLGITPPNGRISINAAPWADVWIDGNAVGQTPLANLSVTLGQHEVIFRHPQLGEQRQTAIVKVDSLTRISANLQR